MKAWEVDRKMGNVKNDTPDCIDTKTEKGRTRSGTYSSSAGFYLLCEGVIARKYFRCDWQIEPGGILCMGRRGVISA
jgi:hypothetical protein